MRFRLCKGYKLRACYNCRRLFETASGPDKAQAKGQRDIVPSIASGRCLDWLPTPPVMADTPEDKP